MNAYELANEIDACFSKADWNVLQAANMLRQQADRIAELEKELNHMRSFFGCDPAYYGMTSAEPVAWMQTWENQDGELKHTVNIEQIGKNDIPLYTHPHSEESVKAKTPTLILDGNRVYPTENTLTDRITELEKDIALKTRDRDVFRNFTLAYEKRIAELERCAEYYRDKYYFDSPAKTYEDAIEECAQRAESYAYMSENFNVLADELRAILKKAREK